MPKTRAEINRAYREKHKEEIKAKREQNKEMYKEKYAEKKKEQKRIKYRSEHEEIYYIVRGLDVHKEIWDFAQKWLEEARCYRKRLEYNTGEEDLKLILKRNKHLERRKLTQAEKYMCENALVYLDNEIINGCGDFYPVYNEVIREHANNGNIDLINEFLKALTDQKMSFNKKNEGKVFYNVRKENKIVKYKDEFGKDQERMVIIRKFKKNSAVSSEKIKVDLHLTPAAFANWGLLNKDELKASLSVLDANEVKVYTNWYYNNDNCYKIYEGKYKGFHIKPTDNESDVIERFKSLQVDLNYLNEYITDIPFEKNNVQYDLINKISNVVATLTQRNILFKHGRLYFNRFTNLKNEFVDKALLLNGKHIRQLFDVKSCFSMLSLILFAQNKHRDNKEVKDLFEIIKTDIYIWVGNELGIKQAEDQTFEQYRDYLKQLFNSWLFSTSRGKRRGDKKFVDQLMSIKFPAFYKWIHSQQEVMKRDEKKSVLSVKCQWLENKLVMNGLFNEIKNMNTITKHDAIYITEDQYSEELKNEMEDKWLEIVTKEIE